jgi:predicted PurR-regulated permease PerM
MINLKKIIIISALILLSGFLIWYFSSLVIYVITSIMLSFIGNPIVKLLRKFKFRNYSLPVSACAGITLLFLVFIIALLISVFIPIIISQASVLADIDISSISNSIEVKLYPLEQKLVAYNFISEDQKIITIISDRIFAFIKMIDFTLIINNLLSFTGEIFVGVFAVLFTTFFFLKDQHLVYDLIMLITPTKYHSEMENILDSSKLLLSRYFIGLCIDLTLITTCYSIGLWIFGIKNAILIASIAGILHVIPYLGPLIGGTLGILIGIASALTVNPTADLLPVILIIAGVIIIVNIIDNIVFQPYIYSNSVKAHPLEIFFIILIGDSIAGIPGMILAIPIYTLIRIVLKEFLNKFRIVQKMTEKL